VLELIVSVLMEEVAKTEGKPKEGVMQIVTSWEERGQRKGEKEGRQELLVSQLRRKLGGISDAIEQRIADLSVERLGDLGLALLDFESEADLRRWLG
jgi:uncharacterized protein YjbJ (UPF0337 family)